MPKQLSADLSERLLALLGASPDGMGIDALAEHLGDAASRRTVQRRLADLAREQRVVTAGAARALRYKLPVIYGSGEAQLAPLTVQAEAETYLPLSPSAEEVRQLVRRPIGQRVNVAYDRRFLEAYRPNETAYLSPELRAHLQRLGKTPDGERPAGTYARNILQRLMIDLSWASSRLEGNTYSLLDTERLLLQGHAAEGKAVMETQMILNHKAAIEFLVDSCGEEALTSLTVRNLHALLAENLMAEQAACGRLRREAVGIAGSVFFPLAAPPLIVECFEQLLASARVIQDPFEQAFFLMVQLPYLQPFDDVNKRGSRLAANIPLIRRNLSPLAFVDVPERAYVDGVLGVYENQRVELLRDVFVWAYERSCQRYAAVRATLGEPDAFRLRFREPLMAVVREMVKGRGRPSPEVVKGAAERAGVTAEHMDHFVRSVLVELESLHEGNFARYRLRPSEYEAWAKGRTGQAG